MDEALRLLLHRDVLFHLGDTIGNEVHHRLVEITIIEIVMRLRITLLRPLLVEAMNVALVMMMPIIEIERGIGGHLETMIDERTTMVMTEDRILMIIDTHLAEIQETIVSWISIIIIDVMS